MTFDVEPTPTAAAQIGALSGTPRKRFTALYKRLKAEGCRAGGFRLEAPESTPSPICSAHFYRDWRALTYYPSERAVTVFYVAQHNDETLYREIAARTGSAVASTSKRDRTPCCEDQPPLPGDLASFLERLSLAEEAEAVLGVRPRRRAVRQQRRRRRARR